MASLGPHATSARWPLTSTGGKQKLGPISKQGDRYLRRILVVGAHSVHRSTAVKKMHRWPFGGRITCESCMSIDVRLWYRQGRLRAGQNFSWLWMQTASRAAPSRCSWKRKPLFCAIARLVRWLPTGSPSSSAYRSLGPIAASADAGRGFAVLCESMAGTADDAWRCFIVTANHSRAGIAANWLMKASGKVRFSGPSGYPRKSACGLAAAWPRLVRFPRSRAVCGSGLMIAIVWLWEVLSGP